MSNSIDVSGIFDNAESNDVAIHPFETDITSPLSPIAGLCAPDGNRGEVDTRHREQFLGFIGNSSHKRLRLNHESARLLSAARKTAKAKKPSLKWDVLLPQAHGITASSSHPGVPLLTEQEERRLQPSPPQDKIEVHSLQYSQSHCSLHQSTDIDPPASITETSELSRSNLSTEKLKLSIANESLKLISRARRIGALPKRAVGTLFDELLKGPKVTHPAELIICTELSETQSTPARGCIPSPSIPEREREFSIDHCASEGKDASPGPVGLSQISTNLTKFISPKTQNTSKEKLPTVFRSKGSNYMLADESQRVPNLKSFSGIRIQELEHMAQAVLYTSEVCVPVDDPAFRPIKTPETLTSSRELVLENDTPKELNNKLQCQVSISGEHATSTVSNPRLANVGFGSLSAFMETRGLIDSNHHSNISHSSSRSPHDKEESTLEEPDTSKLAHDTNIYNPPMGKSSFIKVPSIIGPRFELKASNLIIFLSTDLLKTHLRLVQCLEQRENPPKCFYRDYSQPQISPNLNALIPLPRAPINAPQEADLIISPSVGIILTTSQALSQLYLPGHKPTDPAIRSNLSITSHLKERLFRLTQRYDILYVLISHSSSNTMIERGRTHLVFQMDKSTQESYNSIQEFCSSISSSMKMLPHLIPATPDTIAEWILTLATNHASHCLTTDQLQNISPSPIAFQGEKYRQRTVNQLIKEDETKWEVWLRSLGLNPYAARIVLDILEADGDCTKHSKDGWSEPGKKKGESSMSSFMRSIEMGPLQRLERFKMLLGERLLFKLQQAIELHMWAADDDDETALCAW
ncbi:hypothetical protein N7478_012962 [Penicillium angulare]|uniref:uncharacterized protein n=1 Tax=Penicillium angulare TaxID=116970 RepID=UPI00253FBBDB|nr:uncharacterized protein N7478_012962 [Penicillium angulare]KAJ5256858.1 hypothetical protein N7478_012962 [Penicillium angulare]